MFDWARADELDASMPPTTIGVAASKTLEMDLIFIGTSFDSYHPEMDNVFSHAEPLVAFSRASNRPRMRKAALLRDHALVRNYFIGALALTTHCHLPSGIFTHVSANRS